MNKLYIGNLSPHTSRETITDLFDKFGALRDCRVFRNKDTKESPGFAVVELTSNENKTRALEGLVEYVLDGHQLKVSEIYLSRSTKSRGSKVSCRGGYAGGIYGDGSRGIC